MRRERECLCGCGIGTLSYFARGHVRRLFSALRAIERGEALPIDLLTPLMVEKLGPWIPKGKGMVPTNDYTVFE